MGVEDLAGERRWSWAESRVEADARRREADELVGHRIQVVRYVTLDYRREELHPELLGSGPRLITDESEWDVPTWQHDDFDAIDYGFEITTESGLAFSVTWDPPGDRQGIGLRRLPLLGSGVRADADVAVWTVTGCAVWTPVVGTVVTGVDLHYVPWDEQGGSLWCPRITLHCGLSLVEVVSADSVAGVLNPSADNVAVLHAGTAPPAWTS